MTRLKPDPMPAWLSEAQAEQALTAPDFGLGFKLTKIPKALHALLQNHMAENVERFKPDRGSAFFSTLNPKGFPGLVYHDSKIEAPVITEMSPILEDWCGFKLYSTAVFGIRVYQRGSYLYPHVDRTKTHVISATLCIDHDLEEPWPLSVADRTGKLVEVNMQPGEMLLYEGARRIHGREWALQGRTYASLFCHFAPAAEKLPPKSEQDTS
jgi:hypothetical protein